ncbi:MAG: 50S ribosomal protein L37ae [Candidatus Helarchaeota archaeon]
MGKRTKKVGITGRFGARYGSTVRKRIKRIEERMKQLHKCPQCQTRAVRRVSVGVWQCRKCDYKFTGGAYIPETSEGKKVGRTIKQARMREEQVEEMQH